MGLTSRIVDVNGRSTEILVGGSGEPLVFLHGGGIIEGFEPFESLTDQFSVYVPLMPGYGSTESEPAVTGSKGVVDNVGEVFDALGVDEVVLVGHSLGAWRAAQFAAQHPQRITALVLAAPFGMDVPEHPAPDLSGLPPGDVLAALTNDLSIFDGRLPTGPDPEFMAARDRERRALGHYFPGPVDHNLLAAVTGLNRPTLILWGDQDRTTPVGHLEAWQKALPNSTSTVFPDTGHLLFHERPEAVRAIADFVGAVRSS
jgi:pimeloyl-ACP methyl ester carboxylesterase